MAASDLEAKARAAFIDDHFELAVHLYSAASTLNPNNAELYVDRAQANIKLQKYTDAVADANKAIECEPSMAKAYLRKGIVCIKLEEYQTAITALEIGASLAPGDSRFTKLIKECDTKISEELPRQLAFKVPTGIVALNNLPAAAAQPSQVKTKLSTKSKHSCAHRKMQREASEIIEQGGKTRKTPNNLCLEDYLSLLDSPCLEMLTVANLNQIISLHGFLRLKSQKSVLIEAVNTMELMDLGRSTLQNNALFGGNASLDLKEVIMDLKDLNWQECHATSLATQGADLKKRKRRSVRKSKSLAKIVTPGSTSATKSAKSKAHILPTSTSNGLEQ